MKREPTAVRWPSYADFFFEATRKRPYAYQERLGHEGLPELLVVDTGAGKTAAVILAWLWSLVRSTNERGYGTRRLAYVLPLRTLVEQVSDAAKGYIEALKLSDVAVHTLMGGDGGAVNAWRDNPAQATLFVGTQDMLLSRALMRSYGSSRYVAPLDFGMLNNGTHWVFDEVQLMGAALPTSRQLEGFRRAFGVAQPTATTWMSATVHRDRLTTVDNPEVATEVRLTNDDRHGPLAQRLEGTRTIRRLQLDSDAYEQDVGQALVQEHRRSGGKRTIAVLNTVKRATDVYRLVTRSADEGVKVVLLHSRFRPGDRGRHMTAAVDDEPPPAGTIVVTTQVLEAGVDVTSALLFTEVAPWSSIVQRAGRCNRDGAEAGATLLWAVPPSPAPYEERDLEGSVEALSKLEGLAVTTGALMSQQVAERQPEHAVLRRRDLLDLFDTTPDLSGNEIDVSRFIRDEQDLDVEVFWRDVSGGDRQLGNQAPPGPEELCRVPVGDLRKYVSGSSARKAWLFNPLSSVWERAAREDVRPGRIFLLDATKGGYDSEVGWTPRSRSAVDALQPPAPDPYTRADDSAGGDYGTTTGRWLSLVEHLEDTERCYDLLTADLVSMPGTKDEHLAAGRLAARLHDIGKAHPCFQASLRKLSPQPPVDAGEGPWAKSGGHGRLWHERRYFRHELVSALMLLDPGAASLLEEIPEPYRNLTIYLVAAHHGKVRLAIRALPDETRPTEPGRRYALGVWEGDRVPPVVVPRGNIRSTTLSLERMALGSADDGGVSWTSMALGLRDDPDLGPFRLAFLEALVRLADWQASAAPGGSS